MKSTFKFTCIWVVLLLVGTTLWAVDPDKPEKKEKGLVLSNEPIVLVTLNTTRMFQAVVNLGHDNQIFDAMIEKGHDFVTTLHNSRVEGLKLKVFSIKRVFGNQFLDFICSQVPVRDGESNKHFHYTCDVRVAKKELGLKSFEYSETDSAYVIQIVNSSHNAEIFYDIFADNVESVQVEAYTDELTGTKLDAGEEIKVPKPEEGKTHPLQVHVHKSANGKFFAKIVISKEFDIDLQESKKTAEIPEK